MDSLQLVPAWTASSFSTVKLFEENIYCLFWSHFSKIFLSSHFKNISLHGTLLLDTQSYKGECESLWSAFSKADEICRGNCRKSISFSLNRKLPLHYTFGKFGVKERKTFYIYTQAYRLIGCLWTESDCRHFLTIRPMTMTKTRVDVKAIVSFFFPWLTVNNFSLLLQGNVLTKSGFTYAYRGPCQKILVFASFTLSQNIKEVKRDEQSRKKGQIAILRP